MAILKRYYPVLCALPLLTAAAAPPAWGLKTVRAVEAWESSTATAKVLVAVLDTGVDPYHKDLSPHVWRDPSTESPAVFGWNFVAGMPNPLDDHGHGTHVAGIINAVSHGAATLLPVKYYSDANPGSVNLRNTVLAINYAVEHGAKVINYSGGGPEFSEQEYIALRKALFAGVLLVAAAGNEHQDTDLVENYFYPASYRMPNIISVAAVDIQDRLVPSSNWGVKRVDVAAPGENVYSTLPGNRHGYMTGTSQATAFVTGIAALVLANNPSATPEQVREMIVSSVDCVPGLEKKIRSGGRVNAYRAVLSIRQPASKPCGPSRF